MQWSAFTFSFSKRFVWKTNKKFTWKNLWFRKAAPLFWTKAYWFTRGIAFYQKSKKTYQKTFSNKCTAFRKAYKTFEDVIENKTEKQVNDNDIINVTKCHNNFAKGIFFYRLHYGLSSGKNYHKGKVVCMTE